MPNKADVSFFLNQMKAQGTALGFIFADRLKNHNTIFELQITSKMREETILNLQVEDYCEGPKKNTEFGNNPMWIFGKEVKGKEIYIKITIPEACVFCISFHTAEHSMNYPFK